MRTRDEAPFLASAPPAWAAGALAWVLIAIVAAASLALVLVEVPESVNAPFVLVPVRGTDPVRSLHDGVITAVDVSDADTVRAGAVLFRIGSESVGDRTAERESLGTSLSGGGRRLVNERAKFENQRKADQQEELRLQQRLASHDTRLALVERQASLARDVAARQQRSYEEGLISWVDASKPALEADRLSAEFEQVKADRAETAAAAARLKFEIASRQAAYDEVARSVEEELERSRTRKGMLDREPSRDGNTLSVESPCDGTVVSLVVRTPGTAVSAFDVLAEVVCDGEQLQAELTVPQRGLALLGQGQAVKLRYDAFPYQRFGIRYGTVRWISPSSSRHEDYASFRVLAELDEQGVTIAGEPRRLRPGMRGEASVIIGRRTLASYAFEPLRQMRAALATGRPADE